MLFDLQPVRRLASRLSVAVLLIALFGLFPSPAASGKDKDETKAKKKEDPLVSLGPNKFAGRVRAIVVDPDAVWLATATGGLWVSRDAGQSWSQADDFMESLTFSSLAADPDDRDVMYAGSGEIHSFLHHVRATRSMFEIEGLVLRSPHRGAGIFKTSDGGTTWTRLADTNTPDFYYVSEIAVDPADSRFVLAATSTGLWRSPDGGLSWDRELTGIFLDVKYHPNPSSVTSRAVASSLAGIFRSTDETGTTWTAAALPTSPPLPTSAGGARYVLAPSASEPGVWLAAHIIDSAEPIRILRSTNNGSSFAYFRGRSAAISCANLGPFNPFDPFGPRLGTLDNNRLYTGALWIDPLSNQRLLVGGVNLCYSTNGGDTFTLYPDNSPGTLHNDHHALIADPLASTSTRAVVYAANDGGLNRLGFDTTPTNVRLNNGLQNQQFVSAVQNPQSLVIVGGAQDIGTLRREADTWTDLMAPGTAGADGIPVATDPEDDRYWYYGKTSSWAQRSTDGALSQSCMVDSCNDDFLKSPDGPIRPPLLLEPGNPNTLYLGSAKLWRTQSARTIVGSEGSGWGAIKPSEIEPTNSAENHVITAMAIPHYDVDQIWVGTGSKATNAVFFHNRQLWWTDRLQNIGANASRSLWTQIDIDTPGLPKRPISALATSTEPLNQLFVAFGGWRSDTDGDGDRDDEVDGADALWRIHGTGGDSLQFTNVSAGLPRGPIHALATHPLAGNWVYAGTELGLYLSKNSGATWSAVPIGIARVPISELTFPNDDTLLVATYGRGVWSLSQPVNPQRVFAEGASYQFGRQVGGHVENLVNSDQRRLASIASILSDGRRRSRLTLTGQADVGTIVTALTFLVESSVATTITGPSFTIELFNFDTETFESIYSGPATATDNLVTVNVTGQEARFLGPGLGTLKEVRARLTWTWGVGALPPSVQSLIDKVQWIVTTL